MTLLRDDNNFHEAVWILLDMVGVVFNEQAQYSIAVNPLHPDASYYPLSGPYLTGTGPNYPIELPLPGNNPQQITWESAAPYDSRAPYYPWGTDPEYCHGMVGWGRYRVNLHSYLGELTFFINTIDGNWLNPTSGGGQDIIFRVGQPAWGDPVCEVYDWSTSSFRVISSYETVNSWDVSNLPRGRDVLEGAWDYTLGDYAPANFSIVEATTYPLEHQAIGLFLNGATLDVNAKLTAPYMNVRDNAVFRITDWTDDQNQIHTTTLSVLENNTVKVDGELILFGQQIGEDMYTVTLRGETAYRGFWTGVKTSSDAKVIVRYAHILHTVRGVDLIDGAFLDADYMEIAHFEEYGVIQTDARAKVMNTRIHDGSIGVYAYGDCRDSFYGWLSDEVEQPVEVFNCSGHGFELVDLVPFKTDGLIYHQRSFAVQFSKIHHNRLYGIWTRGTGSPLINRNEIYENGKHIGQIPSHDGVHVNSASPSIHQNMVSGSSYGFHANDAALVHGAPETFWYATPPPWAMNWDFVQHPWLGYNCFVENTINLGNNRNAIIIFGQHPMGGIEHDGISKRMGGSNRFVDPVSGVQASNGTGTVYAGHNCWTPTYNVSGPGTIETYNDFADCATHDLPDCSVPPSPAGGSVLFSGSASMGPSTNSLLYHFNNNDWPALKNEGLNILANSASQQDLAQASILLARLSGITNDQSIENHLSNFWTRIRFSNTPMGTKHAALASLLLIKLNARNSIEALQICSLIEQHCAGTDLAKTGELFRGMVLGGMPGNHAAAVQVVSDMLLRAPGDPEAVALYYSLTHRYPSSMPKGSSAVAQEDIVLYRNYPNPFNPVTEIRFSVPSAMHVRLFVRDIYGHTVAKLIDGEVEAGVTTTTFDASGLNSGMYFCTLETAKGTMSHRMVLVK